MIRKLFGKIILVCLLFMISGCGKASALPVGNDSTDGIVLSEGKFDAILLNTSFLTGSYSVSDSYCTSDKYVYLVNSYDCVSYSYNDYCLNIDKNGTVDSYVELYKPIINDDGVITYSSSCNDLGLDSLPTYEYLDIYYSEMRFDDDGYISSICTIYGAVYSELLNDYYYDMNNYLIKWNSEGACISVEPSDGGRIYDDSFPGYYFGNDGNRYVLTSTGIILVDEKCDYVSKYFDFLNSDILSHGFSSINIMDSDHFCGVYTDADNNDVLCVFKRNKAGISGVKPILLATDSLTMELKTDIYNYNSQNTGFRIVVDDFSSRAKSDDVSESWSILKYEIAAGYTPDIILNTSGYDVSFIDSMISDDKLVDLSDIFKKDESLNGVKITDDARRLFYSGDSVYTIVPAYTYRTIVGCTDYYSNDMDFSYNGFYNIFSPLSVSYNIFYDDTREKFLKRFLAFNGYEFVDYDNNSASFDSDMFISYLEMISNMPEDLESSFERPLYNGIENHYISDVKCTNIGDFNMRSTLSSMGDYVDLGFPCSEGKGSGVINSVDCFMIVSGRKYTNECWDFIKTYLSDEYQGKIFNGVPVTQYGYIIWKGNPYPYTIDMGVSSYHLNGTDYYVDIADDAKVKYIIDHIRSCDRMEFTDYEIQQIVLENAQLYFDGQMTAQQAASAIDTAVEAYLAS